MKIETSWDIYDKAYPSDKKWVAVDDILKIVSKEILKVEISKAIDCFVSDYSELPKIIDSKRLKAIINNVIAKDQRGDDK